MKDLAGLPGSWTGTLTYTDYSDDKKQVVLPTSLTIADLKDSLSLTYSYTEPNKKIVTEVGSLYVYEGGETLFYDGNEFDIVAVRRLGDRLTIIADREGMDNNKEADIRETFIIGPATLNVHKEVKYEGTEKYFMRNQLNLKKN